MKTVLPSLQFYTHKTDLNDHEYGRFLAFIRYGTVKSKKKNPIKQLEKMEYMLHILKRFQL